MPTFRDDTHLYKVMDTFFGRIAADASLVEALTAGKFILRFRYSEPEAMATIDLREAPMTWQFGECDLKPDLEMMQSGDIAHRFWLGQLNIATALATRKVVSRGPVAKALKLLPAIKPTYSIYAQVLRDLGEPLGPVEKKRAAVSERLMSRMKALGRSLKLGRNGGEIDWAGLPSGALRDATGHRAHPSLPAALPAPQTADLDVLRVAMWERMVLIRHFEDRLSRGYAKGEIPTEAIHLSIGQEATAVGVCFALRHDDVIATTHRGHGHMLAKGADLNGMAAEMLAKATGLCGGKGGSMHVTQANVGAIGANGIVGASPLIASGAAHAFQQSGQDRVAVAFMGDGATNQGMFHEAVNFAAVLDLPVVFVIENNLYGEFTPVNEHVRIAQLATRAAAYGIPGVTVDGNDPMAVFEATREAVERARRGEGPTIVECMTYRWHGHMEGDVQAYRTTEEVESWKARCPIQRLAADLKERGIALPMEDGEPVVGVAGGRPEFASEATLRARVEAAFALAFDAPEPGPETLATDIFSPEPKEVLDAVEPEPGTRELTYSQALWEALSEELERDKSVYLMGEDVRTGGYFSVTAGLVETFGPDRIVDTPISEYAIVGSAVGAAMSGARPIAEILFSDFLTTCMDPIVNQAAKLRYMSGGQYSAPMVVRTPGGAGLGMAAQHSQSLEALLTGIPGLIVVAPATPYDAKGLLKAAVRSNNPVLFFENKVLYATLGPVPEGDYLVPLGRARVARQGDRVTVVSVGAVLGRVLEACTALAQEGVEVEVVDVRTLVPLDTWAILKSGQKTGRLVTVEDGTLTHGFGGEVVARVVESAWGLLKAAPRRVAGADVPIPYNSRLENAALPCAESIEKALRAVLK